MSSRSAQQQAAIHVVLDRLSSFVYKTSAADTVQAPSGMTVLGALERITEAIRRNPQLADAMLPTQRSYLLMSVPVDVLLIIFGYIADYETLSTVSRTCTGLNKLVQSSDALWQAVCTGTYPMWTSQIQSMQIPKPVVQPLTPPANASLWSRYYKAKTISERRWLCQHTPEHRVIDFPRGIHCLMFDRDELMCGSGQSNEVVVVDLHTGELRKNTTHGLPGMFGHTQAVTCMQIMSQDTNTLVTGSHDRTVRLWDRSIMAQKYVLNGHTDKVWCVDTGGDRIFSGSSDCSVRVWSSSTGEELASLQDHRTTISTLKVVKNSNGDTIVTGSAGNTVRVWKVGEAAAQCVSKLRGHQKGVFCLNATPEMIVSGSLDNSLRLWDPRQDYRQIAMLIERDRNGIVIEDTGAESNLGYIAMQCDDHKVLAAGPEKHIHVWDLRMRRLVHKIRGHQHWVTTLQFDDKKLITGARDKTVRIWDVSGAYEHMSEIPKSTVMNDAAPEGTVVNHAAPNPLLQPHPFAVS